VIQSRIPGIEVAQRKVAAGTPWKVAIHQHIEPRHWPDALELVPEADRSETRTYLESIAQRMRNVRAHERT
jgi:hypothetical protein